MSRSTSPPERKRRPGRGGVESARETDSCGEKDTTPHPSVRQRVLGTIGKAAIGGSLASIQAEMSILRIYADSAAKGRHSTPADWRRFVRALDRIDSVVETLKEGFGAFDREDLGWP